MKFKKGDRVIVTSHEANGGEYNFTPLGSLGTFVTYDSDLPGACYVLFDAYQSEDLDIKIADIELMSVYKSPLFEALK